MLRNLLRLSKNNFNCKYYVSILKNNNFKLYTAGNSNGKKDDDYFLLLIATYLSYYYQK